MSRKVPRLCPRCACYLKRNATKCPDCGKSFVEEIQPQVQETNQEPSRKRHKHKPRNHPKPVIDARIDEKGKFDINVSDVTFFSGTKSRSVKEARGDTIPEKLKWWEIYKWADRMLARRKIKKVIIQASHEIPDRVSNATMFFLCLFFGWMGAHSLYARNYARGLTILGFFIASITVISIDSMRAFMGVSIGGGLGFIVILVWLLDLIRIARKKYRFQSSRKAFIGNMNFSTRAQLGRKYIKEEIRAARNQNSLETESKKK